MYFSAHSDSHSSPLLTFLNKICFFPLRPFLSHPVKNLGVGRHKNGAQREPLEQRNNLQSAHVRSESRFYSRLYLLVCAVERGNMRSMRVNKIASTPMDARVVAATRRAARRSPILPARWLLCLIVCVARSENVASE